jgi:hypothetical protein
MLHPAAKFHAILLVLTRILDVGDEQVARGMGVAVRGSKDAGLDEAALRCMSEVGGVIRGEVACGGMQKLVKMLHRLPLKSVRVVVALVDVTHDKCLAVSVEHGRIPYIGLHSVKGD